MKKQIETAMENAVETAEQNNACTPHSALACLWMDTVYRLTGLLLKRDNAARLKAKEKPLVPSLRDLSKGVEIIGGFNTYFVEAELNDDGEPQWVQGNQVNLMSVYYNQMSALTHNLTTASTALAGVNLGITANGTIAEREGKSYFVPDTSGPVMTDFSQPVASKVLYYGSQLIKLLRENGGSRDFASKSSMTLNDILQLQDIVLINAEDVQDDPEDVDHMADLTWDIAQQVQKPRNEYVLPILEYAKAIQLQEVFDAWMAVYNRLNDQTPLIDEITYQRERAQDWVKSQKQSDSPVHGKVAA